MKNKPTRVGTVLVFKSSVTEQQAQKALEALKDVIDPSYYVSGKVLVKTFKLHFDGHVEVVFDGAVADITDVSVVRSGRG